ncbi:MAG TPA: nucleotidyltransferase family protein [Acidimicrobiales bacterium]|jgi:hypothetical protein|nr:nucleotidyltransferase family protein [Acidimicrobiales bacterium]
MLGTSRNAHRLQNIFPEIGPATAFTLYGDFSRLPIVVTDSNWQAESKTIVSQGLAGVALRGIRSGSFAVQQSVIDEFSDAQFTDMASTSRVIKQSQDGLDCLRSASIPYVITKGAGIGLQCATVSDRPFMDIDVLVNPSDFKRALITLRANGYRERNQTMQTRDWFNRFCREAINLRSPNGGSIDLHHRISPWFWSKGIAFERLNGRSKTDRIFGTDLLIVSPADNLMIAALHVVSDKSRPGQTIRAWRDLLILVDKCSIDEVVRSARETGLTAWLAWILGCFPENVRPNELIEVLEIGNPKLDGIHRLRSILPPRIASRHPMVGRVFRLPLLNALLFVVGLFFPSREYLQIRYPDRSHSYLTWWRDSLPRFKEEARTNREALDYS